MTTTPNTVDALAREISRWNFEATDDAILVCKDQHDKGQPCEYEPLHPVEAVRIIDELRSAVLEASARALAAMPEQQAGGVPAWWQLVPVEPTMEMLAAAHGDAVLDVKLAPLYMRGLRLNWDAMLAAAPSPSAVQPLSEAQPEIKWPKSRDVGRSGDMTPAGQSVLRVGLDSDNDVYVNLWDRGRHEGEFQNVSIEFCNGGGGGGKSPRTRAALINLMTAIEEDNANDQTKAWGIVTKESST